MSQKVLVADDSLTIQKVIQITLANEPYVLIECLKDTELSSVIKTQQPNLVLLDFNLSEEKTGYDLAKEIKELSPNSKIVMLYGTFDTIDEDLLNSSSVSGKIIKPFDGTKFINLCRGILADSEIESKEVTFETEEIEIDAEDVEIPEEIKDDEKPIEDQWVVQSDQNLSDIDIPDEITAETSTNPLAESMNDWGIDIPEAIEPSSDSVESISIPDPIEVSSEETILPSSDDLEFPSMDDIKLPESSDLDFPDPISASSDTPKKEGPKLVQLEDMDDTPAMTLENNTSVPQTDASDIEKLISDEEEDDLWSADIVEESPSTIIEEVKEMVEDLPQIEPHQLQEVSKIPETSDEILDIPDDFPADIMEETRSDIVEEVISKSPVALDEEKIREMLIPLVDESVKKYCEQQVERIAWELMPDLAENLIKKEISKISDRIMNS